MSLSQSKFREKVIVRPAVVADAAALRLLRLEAISSYPQAFGADYEAATQQTEATWVERIEKYARDQIGMIALAVAGERLVGMLGVVCGNSAKTRHAGTIWGVYLNPDFRGAGIADAMIQAAIAWARGHGLVTVKLGVIVDNIPAVRCYLRCGFTVYGVDPQVIYYDGKYHDEFLMSCRISG